MRRCRGRNISAWIYRVQVDWQDCPRTVKADFRSDMLRHLKTKAPSPKLKHWTLWKLAQNVVFSTREHMTPVGALYSGPLKAVMITVPMTCLQDLLAVKQGSRAKAPHAHTAMC